MLFHVVAKDVFSKLIKDQIVLLEKFQCFWIKKKIKSDCTIFLISYLSLYSALLLVVQYNAGIEIVRNTYIIFERKYLVQGTKDTKGGGLMHLPQQNIFDIV